MGVSPTGILDRDASSAMQAWDPRFREGSPNTIPRRIQEAANTTAPRWHINTFRLQFSERNQGIDELAVRYLRSRRVALILSSDFASSVIRYYFRKFKVVCVGTKKECR
jgi:hypothetical protein